MSSEEIQLIDPAPAIAKHLVEVMDEEGITYGQASGKTCNVELETSGNLEILRKLYERLG
jgi:hypothetical protein